MKVQKVNIGPGPNWSRAGWHTLDFYQSTADFHCDLRESPRLPFRSCTLKTVFCSHVIEHLSDDAVRSLFEEVHRALKYDGVARFSCPDAERAIVQYRAGRCDAAREVVSRAARNAPSHLRLLNVFASFRAPEYQGIKNTPEGYSGGPIVSEEEIRQKVDQLSLEDLTKWVVGLIPDNATYRAHINAHWEAKVVAMLKEAGFSDVYVSKHRQSRRKELRDPSFDNRPRISLFVEARAGGAKKRWTQQLIELRRKVLRTLRRLKRLR